MRAHRDIFRTSFVFLIVCSAFITSTIASTVQSEQGQTQQTGTLTGTVTLGDTGNVVHGSTVTILQLKRSVVTDENGKYEFQSLPFGRYDVSVHVGGVPDTVKNVEIRSGTNVLDLTLRLTGVTEQVTITATGSEQAVSSSIHSVDVIGSTELAKKNPVSLGEALDGEAGIAKRSFGPGTARPVIRGFDGDRVLILQDGNRIGSIGFQSGDHAEPIDLLTVEKVEVVKGPATLLYGSSAIGGVINVVEGHDTAHPGTTGFISALGSSNNNQAGVSGGIESALIGGCSGPMPEDNEPEIIGRLSEWFPILSRAIWERAQELVITGQKVSLAPATTSANFDTESRSIRMKSIPKSFF